MNITDLTLNQLAEVATRELSQQEGFEANKRVAQAGGSVAGNARRGLERSFCRPVITSANDVHRNHMVTQMFEASTAATDDKSADIQSQEDYQEQAHFSTLV